MLCVFNCVLFQVVQRCQIKQIYHVILDRIRCLLNHKIYLIIIRKEIKIKWLCSKPFLTLSPVTLAMNSLYFWQQNCVANVQLDLALKFVMISQSHSGACNYYGHSFQNFNWYATFTVTWYLIVMGLFHVWKLQFATVLPWSIPLHVSMQNFLVHYEKKRIRRKKRVHTLCHTQYQSMKSLLSLSSMSLPLYQIPLIPYWYILACIDISEQFTVYLCQSYCISSCYRNCNTNRSMAVTLRTQESNLMLRSKYIRSSLSQVIVTQELVS